MVQRMPAGKSSTPRSPDISRRNAPSTKINSPRFLTRTTLSKPLPNWPHLAFSPTVNMPLTCTTIVITALSSLTPLLGQNETRMHQPDTAKNPQRQRTHTVVRCACHCFDACCKPPCKLLFSLTVFIDNMPHPPGKSVYALSSSSDCTKPCSI